MISLLAGLVLQVWTMWFLGWQGPRALYVRSIFMPIGFVALAVTEGMVIAGQVCAGISARTGQRERSLHFAPTFLAIGGAVLGLTATIFAVASGPILNGLAVPVGDRSLVTAFVLTVCVATAVGLAPSLVSAAVRGVGRAGPAAAFGAGYTGLAIVAMVVLHLVTDLGVLTVPLGELVAAVVVCAVALGLLPRFGIRLPALRPSRQAMPQLVFVALPVAATFLVLSVLSMTYLRVLRNAGSAEVTGFSLGQMATQFFLVPAQAIGSGAAIAANLQPHDDRSVPGRAGLSALLRLIIPVYLVVGVVIYAARGPVVGLFTSDAAIAAAATGYLRWVGPTLVLFGGTFAILTFLEQAGKATAAFLLNIVYFAVLLVVVVCLPQPVVSSTLARLLAAANLIGFWTLLASARYLLRRTPRRG